MLLIIRFLVNSTLLVVKFWGESKIISIFSTAQGVKYPKPQHCSRVKYIYTHTRIHTYTHIYIHIYIHTTISIYIIVCVCIHICLYIYIQTLYIQYAMCIYICVCISIDIIDMCV